jgi:Lon protease-like protein
MVSPIPLFLLKTVLFPHMPLSLHVFEERYKQMLEDCLNTSTSFGVVALREGEEVGETGVPRQVGTLARIVHVQRLSDGRMNLLVTGASRFRVESVVRGKPYLQARVNYLPEEDENVPDVLRRNLLVAFDAYVKTLQQATRGQATLPDLPEDPEVLAYLIAAAMEGSLDARQQLLEAPGARERMDMELATLRREADLVRRQVMPAEVALGAFSPN